jgi:hypothetical protein
VLEALVLTQRTPDGESQLVAYLVARPGTPAGAAATQLVKDAMAASSPAYMVPARLVWVPAFPLLPNGKVDRTRLVALEDAQERAAPAVALDPLEARIVEQWKARLGRPRIDAGASFVDLGGDSLSFIEAAMELEALLGWLPVGWEKLSIRELARERREKRSFWTRVDSSVLLRAISIVAVVAGHLELPDLKGSVRALFVVSGMSFGRYLVPQVLATGRVNPILRLATKIAVPTVLYALVVNLIFHRPWWPGMFLANNLVSPLVEQGGIGFWFIDVLLQSFLLLALLLSIAPVRRALAAEPFRFALGATVVLAGVSWLGSQLWDTTRLSDRVPHHYLGAMCLGWAIVHATTPRRKLLVVAAMLLTFAAPAWHSDTPLVFPFVATIFLLLLPQVALPLRAGRLVQWIAGASLYIYLMDHQVAFVMDKLGLGRHPLVVVGVAVVAGVVGRKLWDLATAVALRRPRAAAV